MGLSVPSKRMSSHSISKQATTISFRMIYNLLSTDLRTILRHVLSVDEKVVKCNEKSNLWINKS